MAKGNSYERLLAKRLSLFWTGGDRDDIFWRSDSSGGRSTSRSKKGKTTANSAGDIGLLDPVGKPLLDAFCIEVKRGYNKFSIHDILDKPKRKTKQEWEKWIEQAIRSQKQAKSLYWMIIAKRDKRDSIIVLPDLAVIALFDASCNLMRVSPCLKLDFFLGNEQTWITAMLLEEFLERVKPDDIRRMVENHSR
jgi:hypothetical protein